MYSRFIGASGFQLINVNNVPLSLGSWALDTKLLGRKAMINSLARHYFAQGISEAHKVCTRPFPPPYLLTDEPSHLTYASVHKAYLGAL